jgi:hypothetical protein
VRHTLHLTNTIQLREDLLGKQFADCITDRAASFELELFTVVEDWDEGNGYDFVYIDEQFPKIPRGASNWFERKSGVEWSTAGGFTTGDTGNTGATSVVLATQRFEKGNENISIDLTDFINSIIFSGVTGTTGTTGTTGITTTTGTTGTTTFFGFGLKHTDQLEALETLNRKAVGFHGKNTNTFFEPYLETEYDDSIQDDRNFFFLDRDNNLYLYSNNPDTIVSGVTIYDYQDMPIAVLTGDSINEVRQGVFSITINLNSANNVDSVLYRDVWTIFINGVRYDVDQDFYLIEASQQFDFDLSGQFNIDNFFFNFFGLIQNERIRRGDTRTVNLNIRQLYPQDIFKPLDIEYRIYITQDENTEIEVIPFTKIDRTLRGYQFSIDTSWLIPQNYFIEIRLCNGNVKKSKGQLRFTVVSDSLISQA